MKYILKALCGIVIALLLLVMLWGLDFLVHNKAKQDPTYQEIHVPEEKELYNQYGLPVGTEIAFKVLQENESNIIYRDRILSKDIYNNDYLPNFSISMQSFASMMPSDVNLYYVPVPSRMTWEPDYTGYRKGYEVYVGKLQQELPANVTLVDALPALAQHPDEYIFMRTEDSWTFRGAFYAADLCLAQMGVQTIGFDGYDEYCYKTYLGLGTQNWLTANATHELYDTVVTMPEDPMYYYMLPDSTNRTTMYASPKQIEKGMAQQMIVPTMSKSRSGKSIAVSGTFAWAMVEGENLSPEKAGKTLLVLCDDYGKMMVPYFANYYDQVLVVNQEENKWTVAEFLSVFQTYDIDDVVVSEWSKMIGQDMHNDVLELFRTYSAEREVTIYD